MALFSELEDLVASHLPDPILNRFDDFYSPIQTLLPQLDHWSALALLTHQAYSTQAHYKLSLKRSHAYSAILKDLFFYHWKEDAKQSKSHRAAIQEEHRQLGFPIPHSAVEGFLEILRLFENTIEQAAAADTEYFLRIRKPALSDLNLSTLKDMWRQNYRHWEIEAAFTSTSFFELINGQLNRKQMAELASFVSNKKSPID